MKLYRIVWTEKAVEQVDTIFDYISQDSVKAAQKVTDGIFYRVLQLKKFPLSGPEEEELKKFRKGHRYLAEGNYKIIYRIADPVIFINAVFDTRQNPKKLRRIIRR